MKRRKNDPETAIAAVLDRLTSFRLETMADRWADRGSLPLFAWRYAISWGAVNAMAGGSGPGTLVVISVLPRPQNHRWMG